VRKLVARLAVVLIVIGLSACSSDDAIISEEQKFYFLQSLQQVEDAGSRLQQSNFGEDALIEAMLEMDEGLKLAYQVERKPLDKLDLRLGKNYQRYFIKGVEEYRLGIEAADQSQQQQGLQLLQQWSAFWDAEKQAILSKLSVNADD
jgi:hypothetical protein